MWGKNNISWQIRSYPSKGLNRIDTYHVFQNAFTIWSRASDLYFYEVKNYSEKSDIEINFFSGKHGDIDLDGPGVVLAHSFYPHKELNFTIHGDIHFDDDETWTNVPSETMKNLLSVAVHEIGHALGLSHIDNMEAIMYPYNMNHWNATTLAKDDIEAIQSLYGAPTKNKYIPTPPKLPSIPPPPPIEVPVKHEIIVDYCNVKIDAILSFRGNEHYIFSENIFWRMMWIKTGSNRVIYNIRDSPQQINGSWLEMPLSVDHIDAAVERGDGSAIFFSGDRFYTVKTRSRIMHDGYPLSEMGLPYYVKKIDAAMNWRYRNEVVPFIFAGLEYWRFDSEKYKVLSGYPRRISDTWRGLPDTIDAAFTTRNGDTIFFKDFEYYLFDSIRMEVYPKFPRKSNISLLGCFN